MESEDSLYSMLNICKTSIFLSKIVHNIHIFEDLSLKSNCSCSYLLGFNSKINPNTCIFNFTHVSPKGFGRFRDIVQVYLVFHVIFLKIWENNLKILNICTFLTEVPKDTVSAH